MRLFIFNIMRRFVLFYKRMEMQSLKKALKSCGEDVHIGINSDITSQNVSIGNHTSLGRDTRIMSAGAEVKIGSYVMFGPNVTLISGDHRTDMIGRYMATVSSNEKLPENDLDIIIEDDVWIGANSTILKGVTIGTGSIIAAGAVVTKNIPPYSVAGGYLRIS